MPGKRTKLSQAELDKVHRYAATGLTNKEIAGCLGVAEGTFYEYLLGVPELGELLRLGRAELSDQVFKKIKDLGLKRNNLDALKFLARTRLGVTEAIAKPEPLPIPNTPLTPLGSHESMEDLRFVISSELRRLRAKVSAGYQLDAQESAMIKNYTETALRLSKEERDINAFDDLVKMTPEEMKMLAAELLPKGDSDA